MTPIEKILGSQKPEHQNFLCAVCSSEFFWRSVYGGRQCWKCHPPPTPSMVAAANLPTPGSLAEVEGEREAEAEDEGWVECTDGKYRDYFVDAGRMWLVDEGPDYVRFTLVR